MPLYIHPYGTSSLDFAPDINTSSPSTEVSSPGNETDPVWNAEKENYATKQDLEVSVKELAPEIIRETLPELMAEEAKDIIDAAVSTAVASSLPGAVNEAVAEAVPGAVANAVELAVDDVIAVASAAQLSANSAEDAATLAKQAYIDVQQVAASVATDLSEYLPLSGGSMYGTVAFSDKGSIAASTDAAVLSGVWEYTPTVQPSKNELVVFSSLEPIKASLSSALSGVSDTDSAVNSLSHTIKDVHIPTDAFRWQDVYDTQYSIIVENFAAKGLSLDSEHYTDIPIGTQYTVTFMYGGVVVLDVVNTDTEFSTVVHNNQQVWSSEGLVAGQNITKCLFVRENDTLTVTGAQSCRFAPAIPDPTSILARVVTMINDAISKSYAASVQAARKIYLGTGSLNYDFTQPTVVIGTDGLITLGDAGGWTALLNGAIVITYSAVVGAAKTVTVDDETVWSATLSILGASTTKSPSDPIRINAGQVVRATGLLGLAESLDITFYPNA